MTFILIQFLNYIWFLYSFINTMWIRCRHTLGCTLSGICSLQMQPTALQSCAIIFEVKYTFYAVDTALLHIMLCTVTRNHLLRLNSVIVRSVRMMLCWGKSHCSDSMLNHRSDSLIQALHMRWRKFTDFYEYLSSNFRIRLFVKHNLHTFVLRQGYSYRRLGVSQRVL